MDIQDNDNLDNLKIKELDITYQFKLIYRLQYLKDSYVFESFNPYNYKKGYLYNKVDVNIRDIIIYKSGLKRYGRTKLKNKLRI
jgi:hypothetical protein